MGTNRDFDRPGAWYLANQHIKTFGGFNRWIENKNTLNMKHLFKVIEKSFALMHKIKTIENKTIVSLRLDKSKKYINKYILTYTQKYPQTEFIFIVPPYSRLAYSLFIKTDITEFNVYLESLKYMVRLSKVNSNIKVYAWGNEDFLDNLENYRDLTHFSHKINTWMLKSIANEKGLMSVQTIDKYLQEFSRKAQEYNLSKIEEEMKKIKTQK